MVDFQPITTDQKQAYEACLQADPARGCEYSFTNLFLWGRQRMAFLHGHAAVFSQFDRKSVYLFPVGQGDLKKTLERMIHDAKVRDIPFRLTGLAERDCAMLETLYPGQFRFHTDRNGFDYVYAIDDLADLTGRKFQKKRNHLNRFLLQHPDAVTEPITDCNTQEAAEMVEQWYALRLQEDPTRDFHMERCAISKALKNRKALGMEGLLLRVEGKVVAMTLGSHLSDKVFDVHFEKAFDRYDGAYAAINRAFARYLREKYPALTHLDREEDMGLEGLRKAKLSYNPAYLQEKYWACLLEEGYDY